MTRTRLFPSVLMTTFAVVAIGCCSLSAYAAAPAEPEHIPIWDNPSEDGVVIYRIPQILVTRAGTVLACAEARYEKGDGSKADVVIRRSSDGGKTWSKS